MGELGTTNSRKKVSGQEHVSPVPGTSVSIPAPEAESDATFAEWVAGENETVNITGVQKKGQRIIMKIINDGILPRTINFGTGLLSKGAVIGLVSTISMIEFISDGTNFIEITRTINI